MKKTIGVIGLGRFGLELIKSLEQSNIDLIAIDKDIDAVRQAGEYINNVVCCDITNEKELKETGISNADHVIIAIGQDKMENLSHVILTIMRLKQLGVKEITARADKDDYAQVFKMVGVNNVVYPLSIAAERVANKIVGNVADYFNIKNDFDVYEIEISETFETVSLIDLNLRNKYKVNILLIQRNNQMITPTSTDYLMANDHIFVFGRKKELPKMVNFFSNKI
ncbi:Trk system potassium uptake protein TrkA [Alteracholeplasma palmae J233]|uniref:Trk system potassium uptake protein TrkA n=1 Tax=Alteracholeplasma palmae (strain ATCC 49389 / J233) TaxID=1318466 RepID=U4KLR0_ALTPJ|nr:TrkA family potassium uptake protein [Alteracholeplasma palmae]CCV64843.1 Trk system potassium uptake protein TrkA [Alteracholeplasma palmae J233]